jgi:phosphinothricin acetyltransferase
VEIRDATAADVAAINAIYNATVETTTVQWTEELEPVEVRRHWFDEQQAAAHPVLVAEDGATVIGYAAYGDFRDSKKWPGYRFTSEHTVHVVEDWHGRGVGRALMEVLLARATEAGKHVMIAAIDSENRGSIEFHQRLGFVEVGRLPETGWKFGRWLEVVFLERRLS